MICLCLRKCAQYCPCCIWVCDQRLTFSGWSQHSGSLWKAWIEPMLRASRWHSRSTFQLSTIEYIEYDITASFIWAKDNERQFFSDRAMACLQRYGHVHGTHAGTSNNQTSKHSLYLSRHSDYTAHTYTHIHTWNCTTLYLLHFITAHDLAIHCITLQCITSHSIALHCATIQYSTAHCIPLRCMTLHCVPTLPTPHCTQHKIPYREVLYSASRRITLHRITLHRITSHYITSHDMTRYYMKLCYLASYIHTPTTHTDMYIWSNPPATYPPW